MINGITTNNGGNLTGVQQRMGDHGNLRGGLSKQSAVNNLTIDKPTNSSAPNDFSYPGIGNSTKFEELNNITDGIMRNMTLNDTENKIEPLATNQVSDSSGKYSDEEVAGMLYGTIFGMFFLFGCYVCVRGSN
ncbi:hypothetical protein HOG98_08715 [bacterium]|jgi:hypothetical protein|nr:hypothetical protein [bacterium]